MRLTIPDRTVSREVDELMKLSIFNKDGKERGTEYIINTSSYTL